MKDARLSRVRTRKKFTGLAWSPSGRELAAFSKGKVYVFAEKDGAFRSTGSFKVYKGAGAYDVAVLQWQPSGRRLLVGSIDGERTYAVDLGSRAVSYLGAGVGVLDGNGRSMLWYASAFVGGRKLGLFDRQDPYGGSLPLEPAIRDIMAHGPILYSALSTDSPLTLCGERRSGDRLSLAIECVDADGRRQTPFTLAVSSEARVEVTPDPSRTVFLIRDSSARSVRLVDRDSVEVAKGDVFISALRGGGDASRYVSLEGRVSWSPDGHRLATEANDGIVIWDWREGWARSVAFPK